ncbi:MAG: sulfatase [Rhodospirillales bacterium]|nr:sulfatase [Rhodospirillales bacterium]
MLATAVFVFFADLRAAQARPNFVVISTDDQTAQQLQRMPKTLELLAAKGTVLSNFHVAEPLCEPSRVSFLTGQYPHNHGITTNATFWGPGGSFDNDKLGHANTIAAWLQNAGYYTSMIGKYMNGLSQNTKPIAGWSDWQVVVNPTSVRMYDYTMRDNNVLVPYGSAPEDYKTDVLAERAIETIRERAAAGNPFFMWLSVTAPHIEVLPDDQYALRPAPRHAGRFARTPLPKPPSYNEADVSDKPSWIRKLPLIDAAGEAELTDLYRSEIRSLLAVDDLVEGVMTALADERLLDNTVVFFTSDNGYEHGEHRLAFGKKIVYEEGTRMPLLARGGCFAPGKKLSFPAVNLDLTRTIVDLAGAKPGRKLDGQSLCTLQRNAAVANRRAIILTNGHSNAVRTKRYVYIEHADGSTRELYDLATDPYQLVSLHNSPAHAAIRSALAADLAKLETCKGAAACLVQYP